jgi:hypothetical protein
VQSQSVTVSTADPIEAARTGACHLNHVSKAFHFQPPTWMSGVRCKHCPKPLQTFIGAWHRFFFSHPKDLAFAGGSSGNPLEDHSRQFYSAEDLRSEFARIY